MKTLIKILLLGGLAATNIAMAQAEAVKVQMFFDLGNVIVDTSDWNNVHYLPDAKEYLGDLKTKGYGNHLLVNFVDRLGTEVYHNCEEKFAGVVRFLNSKWHDTVPFDWTQYDSIILPATDALRKPRPNMYINALASSCPAPVFFQSEDEKEILTARFMGIAHWRTNLSQGVSVIPEAEIQNQIQATGRFIYPSDCQIFIPEKCELSQADMARIIAQMPPLPNPVPPLLLPPDLGGSWPQ
jgi:hypothetical protein